MNKRVYLFELDSVRKTDEEILIGQQALYDELFGNGNTVILSMNQITDSKAILCMLYKQETYEVLKSYLTNGLLRISRYGSIRTTSQYLQNAIRKNLSKNNDVFIFSALPVKSNQKRLLLLMREVLMNADLSAIKEYIDGTHRKNLLGLFDEFDDKDQVKENTVTEMEAEEYLKILYRFLELVLLISMYDEASNPAIDYCSEDYEIRNFLYFMECILQFSEPEQEQELWRNSCTVLRDIMDMIEPEDRIYLDRSVWIKELYERAKNADSDMKRTLQYAEMIVDLCYNYTVEYSIFGSSKHYRRQSMNTSIGEASFQEEFFNHLCFDWNNNVDPSRRFLQKESNNFEIYKGDYPKWKKGNRVIKRRIMGKHKQVQVDEISLYECDYRQRRKATRREDFTNILKVVGVTCVYIAVMIGMDRLMSHFENIIGEVIKSSVTFLVIIFISALIDRIIPIPDIIDCVRMFFASAWDIGIIASQKTIAYLNRNNFHIVEKDKVPPQKMQEIYMDQSLGEYKKLAKERPYLFHDSNLLPIVDPLDPQGEREILTYEMVHNVKIGVNYESRFHMLVVDLVRGKEDKLFPYERLIPIVAEGAVVVVPIYDDKYILLSQFRHAMRETQLGFPRGFGEFNQDGSCLGAEANACKEICEELGISQDKVSKPEYLGEVIADSGVSGNKVAVYKVIVDEFNKKVGYEGIVDVNLLTEEELSELMQSEKINDGFTLAAWGLLLAKKTRNRR